MSATTTAAVTTTATAGDTGNNQGVLLYYKYTPTQIPDLAALAAFYDSNCASLGLLGRVRLAPQGVNVTVGGTLSSLRRHTAALLREYGALFEGTDFKFATCDGPVNAEVARECGFTSLSVRVVKELVTLGPAAAGKVPGVEFAGRHLSAVEFHTLLQNAGDLMKEESPVDFKKMVLLDARNLYETRIGKFESPNVETLDPATRQYSDLPTWIDSNADKLRGNCVLMYCTGGIRCEMASAYIRSKGAGFENVFQLFGGIQRYLEQFPDGGFFKGKNFVYDHRIAVGSSNEYIVGKCLLCGTCFDDYSSRCRCTFCRMLVLVCYDCQKEGIQYVCELCHKYGKVVEPVPSVDDDNLGVNPACDTTTVGTVCHSHLSTSYSGALSTLGPLKKLKILCLHGFRQNASSFKGRTAALAKKLKSLAELVFVDAPHELPFIYQPGKSHNGCTANSPQYDLPPKRNCNKKYAWLVAPEFLGKKASDWEKIYTPFDPLQYQQQTQGFKESLSFLESVFSTEGPFDGILGFSQGAAMAALICAQRGRSNFGLDFRFVILCSGFAVNLEGLGKGLITCPSLHVFGNEGGGDRQISSEFSRDLASYFEDGCRMIVEHESGHIIPTRPPHINDVREFLRRFV